MHRIVVNEHPLFLVIVYVRAFWTNGKTYSSEKKSGMSKNPKIDYNLVSGSNNSPRIKFRNACYKALT